MSTGGRTLHAWIDEQRIGTLHEGDGTWQFGYDDAWSRRPDAFDLSPHLPRSGSPIVDAGSLRPVQWYFDNLLPEEGQRQLLAGDARIDASDAFGLLQHFGAESAGSLTLLPGDGAPPAATSLRPLPDDELSARIAALPKLPLTHDAPKRMSLAGAQHKLAVVAAADGQLAEPVGARASTHILKPDHPDSDYPHSAANEWFTMRLAGALGLPVPEVHLRHLPQPIYLVRRFDRAHTEAGTRRLHAVDACQLLGLAHLYKYSQGSVDRLAELALACRAPAPTRALLFDWIVFNLLVGNADAHLKNLSFLVSHEGVRLAPFYDLLSVAVYDSPAMDGQGWPQRTALAWPLMGHTRFTDIGRDTVLAAGAALGLQAATARRRLDLMHQRIQPRASALLDEYSQQCNARPHPAAAGELRCMRAIVHGVVRDMCDRLR